MTTLAILILAADTILLDDCEVDSITWQPGRNVVRFECGDDAIVEFDDTQQVELINGACVVPDLEGDEFNLAFFVTTPLDLTHLEKHNAHHP